MADKRPRCVQKRTQIDGAFKVAQPSDLIPHRTMLDKRKHWAEFGDQQWMSGWIREGYLDCLNFGLRVGGQFRQLHTVFADWTKRNEHLPILDLGSGGGGPIETMLREAHRSRTRLPQIFLSDLHPSVDHYARLSSAFSSQQLSFISQPVSATQTAHLQFTLRSLCATFHHFRPETARDVIRDALTCGRSLLIVEPLQRDLRHLLLVLLSGPFAYMLAPLFASRWSWRKFLFTSIVPILPLMVMWDGVVSVLRTYTASEIKSLVPEELAPSTMVTRHELKYLGFWGATCVEISRVDLASGPLA